MLGKLDISWGALPVTQSGAKISANTAKSNTSSLKRVLMESSHGTIVPRKFAEPGGGGTPIGKRMPKEQKMTQVNLPLIHWYR